MASLSTPVSLPPSSHHLLLSAVLCLRTLLIINPRTSTEPHPGLGPLGQRPTSPAPQTMSSGITPKPGDELRLRTLWGSSLNPQHPALCWAHCRSLSTCVKSPRCRHHSPGHRWEQRNMIQGRMGPGVPRTWKPERGSRDLQPGPFRPHPTDERLSPPYHILGLEAFSTYQRSLWGRGQQQAARSGYGATRSPPRWPVGSCRNSLRGSTHVTREQISPAALPRLRSPPSAGLSPGSAPGLPGTPAPGTP